MNGIILVFGLEDRESFEKLSQWLEIVKKERSVDDPPMVIVGNKVDLEEERVVQTQEGEALAASISTTYIETSATNNVGILELYKDIFQRVYDREMLNEKLEQQ